MNVCAVCGSPIRSIVWRRPAAAPRGGGTGWTDADSVTAHCTRGHRLRVVRYELVMPGVQLVETARPA